MTKVRDLKHAEELLAAYIPQVKELLGKDLTLVRMTPLLKALGNPQSKLKIIHIAGTSGKTSTSYYVAALLKASDKKVGLTVSPHLDSVTERVQINLRPLPDQVFCQALGEFLDLIAPVEPQPTYFELLITFVYWYFHKASVDYAVIETGLGGSFDATNVAGNRDKVCVITDIGLDHMHVLGSNVPEIASQKAGIIHANNYVFMNQQPSDVLAVFEGKAKQQKATLNVLSNIDELKREVGVDEFKALPEYQQRNWLLAYSTYEYVAKRDGLSELNDAQLADSMNILVPGRMEVRMVGGKTLVMDGAHNEQKMTAFVSSFQKLYPNKKVSVLLSLKQGKEYKAVLPLLKPITDKLIITTFKTAQDLPAVSIDPDELANRASEYGFKDVVIEPDYKKAYKQLIAVADDMAIITGSFYLLACIRPYIL